MARRYDLVVVGMGSAGMVAAEFATTLGVRVAAVERHRFGGDCLWTGCVPSKSLLASAKAAHVMRNGERFGLPKFDPDIDTAQVWSRIRAVRQQISATDDDPARYRAMGIDVLFGRAALASPNCVRVAGEDGSTTDLATRFVLVATGSRPAVPNLPGLEAAGYLTSESIFELDRAPDSMVIIGGGPIAVEMAQGLRRLGVGVTVLQRGPTLLPHDESSLVTALTDRLLEEGVELGLNVGIEKVTVDGKTKSVHGTQGGHTRQWAGEELLVAVGRLPNTEGLGLEELGIAVGHRGVEVDDRMRTAVASVYVAGDLTGRHLFTHSAGYEGVRAVRDMFFPGKGKITGFVPWCTFTDPELAHAGMTVSEAHARYRRGVETWRHDLTHSDRARADGATEGSILVVTHRKKVIGAHILAPGAGELIHELALAIRHDLKLTDVASLIHVYPTLATGVGQLAADAAYQGARRMRWLVRKEKRV